MLCGTTTESSWEGPRSVKLLEVPVGSNKEDCHTQTIASRNLNWGLRMRASTFHRSCFRFATMCTVLIPLSVRAQQPPPHWSYCGVEGPDDWGKIDHSYAVCSSGKAQSPIDIRGARKTDLPALRFDYNSVPLNVVDNGHTIQVNYPAGSSLTVGQKTYQLKQFHFHHPSEDHANGHTYDMEVHLVHEGSDAKLAVVAIFLKKRDANQLIDSIWQNLPTEKGTPVDVPGITLNAKDLLPSDHGYYTYVGSLTTPPCSEGVTWYVMKHPVTLSGAQLALFAKLYPRDARPIQSINHREILVSK
jgi:carbonic anhydrase